MEAALRLIHLHCRWERGRCGRARTHRPASTSARVSACCSDYPAGSHTLLDADRDDLMTDAEAAARVSQDAEGCRSVAHRCVRLFTQRHIRPATRGPASGDPVRGLGRGVLLLAVRPPSDFAGRPGHS